MYYKELLEMAFAVMVLILAVIAVFWFVDSRQKRFVRKLRLSPSVAEFFSQRFGTEEVSFEELLLLFLELGIAGVASRREVTAWKKEVSDQKEDFDKLPVKKQREMFKQPFEDLLKRVVLLRIARQKKSPRYVLSVDIANALASSEQVGDVVEEILEACYGGDWEVMRSAIIARFPSPILANTFLMRDFTNMAQEGAFPNLNARNLLGPLDDLTACMLKGTNRFVVITGREGVGKTSLLQLLAYKINDFSLVKRGLLPGTKVLVADYREILARSSSDKGALESALLELLDAVSPNDILVVDEAGEFLQDPVVREVLKPRLSAKEGLRLVVATTTVECRNAEMEIRKTDPAFRRRYKHIEIHEPSQKDTVRILREWARDKTASLGIPITASAMAVAARLGALHYVDGQGNPSGALIVLEDALVLRGISQVGALEVCEAMHARVPTLPMIRLCHLAGNYLPREQMVEDISIERVRRVLEESILGQEHVLDSVIAGLAGYLAGMVEQEGPAGVWLFLGPTGTGKTELAKVIAQALGFDRQTDVLLIEGQLYQEAHTMSALFGSPAGYVGYEDAPLLDKPYPIIIVDEIEKMHPEVAKSFLGILHEGIVRLRNGVVVNFKGSFIAFTSNIGSKRMRSLKGSITPDEVRAIALEELREVLPPEFIGRLTANRGAVLAFVPLTSEVTRSIVRKVVDSVSKESWIPAGWNVQVTGGALDFIAAVTSEEDAQFGARPLRGVVRAMQDSLAEGFLSEVFVKTLPVVIEVKGRKLRLLAKQGNSEILL